MKSTETGGAIVTVTVTVVGFWRTTVEVRPRSTFRGTEGGDVG
jgi:hypothetical protein